MKMKIFLEILSILETELSGSSGSFIALVMHLKLNKTFYLVLAFIFSGHLLHLQGSSSDEACWPSLAAPFLDLKFYLITQ